MNYGHLEHHYSENKDEYVLPVNQDIAIKRFMSLENKFYNNLSFSKMYRAQTNK